MKKQNFPGALILILAVALALSLLRGGDQAVSAQVQVIRPSSTSTSARTAAQQPSQQEAGNRRARATSSIQPILSTNQMRSAELNSPVTPPREDQ